MNAWTGPSHLPEERLGVLEQWKYVQTLFQEQQKAESLHNFEWMLWSSLSRRLQEQQQKIEKQQEELDTLKEQFKKHFHQQPPAAPDAFQRWMIEHRAEVMRHRGKHIAVHSQEGIIASANTYASLIDELKRQGISDTDFVIEFISPTFAPK